MLRGMEDTRVEEKDIFDKQQVREEDVKRDGGDEVAVKPPN